MVSQVEDRLHFELAAARAGRMTDDRAAPLTAALLLLGIAVPLACRLREWLSHLAVEPPLD